MATTAYNPSGPLASFVPEADGLYEGAKLVAYVLIKTGFDVNTLDGLDATWNPAVVSGDLVEVSPVAGTMGDPSENTRPGMGYLDTEMTSMSYTVDLEHYGVDANLAFYNKLNGSREYGVGFVFEDEKMYVPLDKNLKVIPVKIYGRPEANGELGGPRKFKVTFGWKVKSLPYSLPVPAGRFKNA